MGRESLHPRGIAAPDPYLSPLSHHFLTRVPLFIQTGGAEVTYDIVTFLETNGLEGNLVEPFVVPDAPHDIALCRAVLSWGVRWWGP
jgi:hypothetical protein